MTTPTLALSIQQPWADLICFGWKDIENRSWRTKIRGLVFIHASKQMDYDAWYDVRAGRSPVDGSPLHPLTSTMPLYRGGLVGVAEIVDCVSKSDSCWFVGRYGLLIKNALPIDFIPCKGKLGFFEPAMDAAGNPL